MNLVSIRIKRSNALERNCTCTVGSRPTSGDGGAIHLNDLSDLPFSNSSNTLLVKNSSITLNAALRSGGIFNHGGNLYLDSTTIEDNSSYTYLDFDGGVFDYQNGGDGIYNLEATATISNSTITSNNAFNSSGGGIANRSSTVAIDTTTIDRNRASYGAGVFALHTNLTLDNSTISNNKSISFLTESGESGIAAGGGLFVGGDSIDESTTTITNSTIANNTYSDVGGGITLDRGILTIANSTIYQNAALGQSIFVNSAGVVNVDSSIFYTTSPLIGGNNNSKEIQYIYSDDKTISVTNSIIGSAKDNNSINGSFEGTVFNVDPLLDPNGLQNNGGSTETIALLENSPAIGAGSNPNNLTTDQRGEGYDRVRGNTIDVGAYEYQDDDFLGTPDRDTLTGDSDGQ